MLGLAFEGRDVMDVMRFELLVMPGLVLTVFEFVDREVVERLDVTAVELLPDWRVPIVPVELFRPAELDELDLDDERLVRELEEELLRELLLLEDCRAFGAGAACDDCCFAAEEPLDFLLLPDFFANAGSARSIKAEASTKNINVSFRWYFGLNMICPFYLFNQKVFFYP
ncbi:MAG: hypothetical protein JW715_02875 [Sedimentisphaerales bacterium]|nr:hypothetical protein [Sedimentisphaerales bacterium]